MGDGLRELREQRLRPIRRVIDLVEESGFSFGQLFESVKAVAGFLNSIGIDKGKLTDLLAIIDLVKNFQEVEGPWADETALAQRLRIAMAIARIAAEVTGTSRDDTLVDLVGKYLGDDRVIAFLALVLADAFGGDEDIQALGSMSEIEDLAKKFEAQAIDPMLLIQLLPVLLELLQALRKLRRGTKLPASVSISEGATNVVS